MRFFSLLGFGQRARLPLSRSPAQRIYVVDATGLVDNRLRNGNGQASPRDYFIILRNLAQFSGRERIDLVVIFIGRPLREAREGAQYKGVKVHYADHAEAQAAKLIQLVREYLRTRDVVLITGNPELERQAVALNAACMRPSTLRKAMDERDDRGDRGDRNNNRPSRSYRGRSAGEWRKRSERPPEPEQSPAPERPAANKPSVSEPADEEKPEPGVLDLIDPA